MEKSIIMRVTKYMSPALTALILILISATSVLSSGKDTGSIKSIPVMISGKRIDISKDLNRTAIKKTLSDIIKVEASVDTPEHLQYDVILVEDQAPVTIIFNFNKKGYVDHVMFDSYTSDQNPPVIELLSWLTKNAGKPKVRKKSNIIWFYGGWKIEHLNKKGGEDSVYRIEFTISN